MENVLFPNKIKNIESFPSKKYVVMVIEIKFRLSIPFHYLPGDSLQTIEKFPILCYWKKFTSNNSISSRPYQFPVLI
jgi:hypothetical protein